MAGRRSMGVALSVLLCGKVLMGVSGAAGFPLQTRSPAVLADESTNQQTSQARARRLGGGSRDVATSIARDVNGNTYVLGYTSSPKVSVGAVLQRRLRGESDVFVAKLGDGGRLRWLTYLGGKSKEFSSGIALTQDGDPVVTGWTFSANFPTTAGALDSEVSARDPAEGFVTTIHRTGRRILSSTLIGGSGYENPAAVEIAPDGSLVVVGVTGSHDFPLADPTQPTLLGLTDAFVSRMSADGRDLLFSTYLGGEGLDQASAVSMDDGRILVAGGTTSKAFPTKNAVQDVPGSMSTDAFAVDGFVTSLTESEIGFSTYLGGSQRDFAHSLDVVESQIFVAGETGSSDFPGSRGGSKGGLDGFVVEISGTGEALESVTLFGGSGDDSILALEAEIGRVHVSGFTKSSDLPTRRAIQDSYKGGTDGFAATLDTSLQEIEMATFIGSGRTDFFSDIVISGPGLSIAGWTNSRFLLQSFSRGRQDAILVDMGR